MAKGLLEGVSDSSASRFVAGILVVTHGIANWKSSVCE
jgi:hypothetical protein